MLTSSKLDMTRDGSQERPHQNYPQNHPQQERPQQEHPQQERPQQEQFLEQNFCPIDPSIMALKKRQSNIDPQVEQLIHHYKKLKIELTQVRNELIRRRVDPRLFN